MDDNEAIKEIQTLLRLNPIENKLADLYGILIQNQLAFGEGVLLVPEEE